MTDFQIFFFFQTYSSLPFSQNRYFDPFILAIQKAYTILSPIARMLVSSTFRIGQGGFPEDPEHHVLRVQLKDKILFLSPQRI